MEYILVNGFKELNKDMVNGEEIIMKYMLVNGKIIKQMVMENMIIKMEDGIKESLRIF